MGGRETEHRKAQKGRNCFALRGAVCYSKSKEELVCREKAYVVCEEGICQGVFEKLPEKYEGIFKKEYENAVILPGLVDLHVHAPQYAFAGTGMDEELLEWLNTRTFPEEEKYEDLTYARAAYRLFAQKLKESGTTRACIFGTVHREATEILMEEMEKTGLKTAVGKVSMDRNAPGGLLEGSWEEAKEEVRQWLWETKGRFQRVTPILTPRFVPSCSDELLKALGEIQRETGLPVQSHLSENPSEIQWVRELCPWAEAYGEVYKHFGLLGSGDAPAIMAHCVYSGESEQELRLLKENPVYVAHCPQSNTDLASGIAPVRQFLEEGISMGLGTDIAGGHKLSVFQAMAEAVQVSKLRFRLKDSSRKPLRLEEAFYLGTKGGGGFFGKAGSLEAGYAFDALVLDDSRLKTTAALTVRERLERIVYLSEDRDILEKYVDGILV